MIRCRARFDLVKATRPDRALMQLPDVPDGGTAEVLIDVIKPDPAACRILAGHQHRIDLVLVGSPRTVSRWLDLIENPDVLTTGGAS